jgi:hypothetical protein
MALDNWVLSVADSQLFILYVFFWVFPRRHIVICRRFETDSRFRNVGKSQSDAGEIPKRIHTIFKTRRKFKIRSYLYSYTNPPELFANAESLYWRCCAEMGCLLYQVFLLLHYCASQK